jgi:hypothetical protein
MGTITKGTIPSTIREGGFATTYGIKNLGTITTKNCVVEHLKGICSHQEKKLHNKVNISFYHIKQKKASSIIAQEGMVLSY